MLTVQLAAKLLERQLPRSLSDFNAALVFFNGQKRSEISNDNYYLH